jgi:beta-lactamase class A
MFPYKSRNTVVRKRKKKKTNLSRLLFFIASVVFLFVVINAFVNLKESNIGNFKKSRVEVDTKSTHSNAVDELAKILGLRSGAKETAALPHGENIAWVACDLAGDKFYGQNEDAVLKVASLAKLPVALVIAKMASRNEIGFEDQVEFVEEDFVSGTGSLQDYIMPGESLSVRRLCQLMIVESDNIAYRMLIRFIGLEQIQAELRSLDIAVSFEGGNLASARDISRVLHKIWMLVPDKNSRAEELIGWMLSSAYKDGIAKGLPPESLVANKEGFISGSVVADAGFILSPRPWIMVVIVNDLDDGESYQIIREIAARLYDVINPKKPAG